MQGLQNRIAVYFFWQHVKPYKWFFSVMLLAPIISSFYPFAYNYVIKMFLDVITTNNEITWNSVILPTILFALIQIILDFSWRMSDIAEWKAVPLVRQSILIKSYDYVQHHSYKFFQDNLTGSISSKLKSLLTAYDYFLKEIHSGLFQQILKIFVGFIGLSLVSIKLTTYIFIWSTTYIFIVYLLSAKLNQLSKDETESLHKIIGQVSDKINNIFTIFSFASRGKEICKLESQMSYDFIPRQIKTYKFNFLAQIISNIFYCVMFTCTILYLVHLKIQFLITVGDFTFVLGMILTISDEMWRATINMQKFARMLGDLTSSLDILYTSQENLDRKGVRDLKIANPTIEFKNVEFKYNDSNLIFSELKLKIRAGEKIGIVGHSGAGKSSLINLLLKYFQVTKGQILIDDQDIVEVSQNSLRASISVIPQDTILFHDSLIENIRYGKFNATDDEIIEACKKAHIHDFISTLPRKYQTYVGERGVKLSGGQRQRIAIARAILKDAPIIILDEATSALDSQTEKLIQDSLNVLINTQGKTVIAIAHRLSTLKHVDKIIVMDQGKIIEEGSHEELIRKNKSLYKNLWNMQNT